METRISWHESPNIYRVSLGLFISDIYDLIFSSKPSKIGLQTKRNTQLPNCPPSLQKCYNCNATERQTLHTGVNENASQHVAIVSTTRAVRDCLIRPFASISECLVSWLCLGLEHEIGHRVPNLKALYNFWCHKWRKLHWPILGCKVGQGDPTVMKL